MDALVFLVIAIIIGSIVLSAWKQISMSIIASIACVIVMIVVIIDSQRFLTEGYSSELFYNIAFSPLDLTHPSMYYTLLTSMYTHASFAHIFFNIFALVLIGTVFETRIGVRPFIVLYLLSGLAGTLLFAALHWGDAAHLVGASGAIMGILGGFGRLYPTDKVTILFFPPVPAYAVVVGFLFLQLLLIPIGGGIAYEAHIGGIAAGVLLAPLVIKLPLQSQRARIKVKPSSLKKLATTPELEAMLKRIDEESVPEVKKAWVEHFVSSARCPECGSSVTIERGTIKCEKGHVI